MAPNLAWVVVVSLPVVDLSRSVPVFVAAVREDRGAGRQGMIARERRIASALPTAFAAAGRRLLDGVGLSEGNLRSGAAGARMLRGMRPLTAG